MSTGLSDISQQPSGSCTITSSYEVLRSFYIEASLTVDGIVASGRCKVAVEEDAELSAEGTLNNQGILSGMTKIYRGLDLRIGSKIYYRVSGPSLLVITKVVHPEAKRTDHVPERISDVDDGHGDALEAFFGLGYLKRDYGDEVFPGESPKSSFGSEYRLPFPNGAKLFNEHLSCTRPKGLVNLSEHFVFCFRIEQFQCCLIDMKHFDHSNKIEN